MLAILPMKHNFWILRTNWCIRSPIGRGPSLQLTLWTNFKIDQKAAREEDPTWWIKTIKRDKMSTRAIRWPSMLRPTTRGTSEDLRWIKTKFSSLAGHNIIPKLLVNAKQTTLCTIARMQLPLMSSILIQTCSHNISRQLKRFTKAIRMDLNQGVTFKIICRCIHWQLRMCKVNTYTKVNTQTNNAIWFQRSRKVWHQRISIINLSRPIISYHINPTFHATYKRTRCHIQLQIKAEMRRWTLQTMAMYLPRSIKQLHFWTDRPLLASLQGSNHYRLPRMHHRYRNHWISWEVVTIRSQKVRWLLGHLHKLHKPHPLEHKLNRSLEHILKSNILRRRRPCNPRLSTTSK